MKEIIEKDPEYIVFVQENQIGMTTILLSLTKPSFIYYNIDQWKTDSGQTFPEKKYFEHVEYINSTREFKAIIDWEKERVNTEKYWRYSIIFSKDWNTIETGFVYSYDENMELLEIDSFEDLRFYRYNRLNDVYV